MKHLRIEKDGASAKVINEQNRSTKNRARDNLANLMQNSVSLFSSKHFPPPPVRCVARLLIVPLTDYSDGRRYNRFRNEKLKIKYNWITGLENDKGTTLQFKAKNA